MLSLRLLPYYGLLIMLLLVAESFASPKIRRISRSQPFRRRQYYSATYGYYTYGYSYYGYYTFDSSVDNTADWYTVATAGQQMNGLGLENSDGIVNGDPSIPVSHINYTRSDGTIICDRGYHWKTELEKCVQMKRRPRNGTNSTHHHHNGTNHTHYHHNGTNYTYYSQQNSSKNTNILSAVVPTFTQTTSSSISNRIWSSHFYQF